MSIRVQFSGVYQNYIDYSECSDRALLALQGASPADPNRFPLTKNGEYVGRSATNVKQHGDHQSGRNQRNFSGPDMPYPKSEQRDDFKAKYQPKPRV